MHYSPNGSWPINNVHDIHSSTNIVQGSLIAHGFVSIVRGSTSTVHGSIKNVHGSIYIVNGSTSKMFIYHEFCSRFLAWFHHLMTITHGSTTDAHSSINRGKGSTKRTCHKMLRLGWFWPNIFWDCKRFVKGCGTKDRAIRKHWWDTTPDSACDRSFREMGLGLHAST